MQAVITSFDTKAIKSLENKYKKYQWWSKINLKEHNQVNDHEITDEEITDEEIKAIYSAVLTEISGISWEEKNKKECQSLISCFMDLMTLANSSSSKKAPSIKNDLNDESKEICNYLIKFFENASYQDKTLASNIDNLQDLPDGSTIGPIALIVIYSILFIFALAITLALLLIALGIALASNGEGGFGWAFILLSAQESVAHTGEDIGEGYRGLIGEIQRQLSVCQRENKVSERKKFVDKIKKALAEVTKEITSVDTQESSVAQGEKKITHTTKEQRDSHQDNQINGQSQNNGVDSKSTKEITNLNKQKSFMQQCKKKPENNNAKDQKSRAKKLKQLSLNKDTTKVSRYI
jgi:hypothetical protein